MNFDDIPFGSLEAANAVVEVPKGSRVKYEYDEALDIIKVDFVFSAGFSFLENYGFIPHTRGGDGDHLDVFIISREPFSVGTVVPCRPIGMVELLDRGEEDNKILAIPVADGESGHLRSIEDLPRGTLERYETFFKVLAQEKKKIIEIKGFYGRDRALDELARCKV